MFAELDIPGTSGEPKRIHLEHVENSSGGAVHDPRLDTRPPEVGFHAWEVFWRVWNGQRVEYRELEAYIRLSGDALEPWEVAAVRMMDGAVAKVMADRARGNDAGSGKSTD